MIILDRNTKNLEVKLGEAIVTNNIPVVCNYLDIMSPSYGPAVEDVLTNGVTAVVMSGEWLKDYIQRHINEISVNNTDTIPHDVIIQLNNNSTIRQIKRVNLLVGDSLHYENGKGWYVLDKYGAPKTSVINQDDVIDIFLVTADNLLYTGTHPKITVLYDGLEVRVKLPANNAGAVQFNPNGLGIKDVKNFVDAAFTADELQNGGWYIWKYNGTLWQCLTVTDKIVNGV